MSEAQIREMFRLLHRPTQSDRERWATSQLVAEIWCCGDELDGLCYQPQIDRVEPNRRAGFPWVHRTEVWRGTFVNGPTTEEYERLTTELREGAKLHGIELVEREGFWAHGTKPLAGSQEGSAE